MPLIPPVFATGDPGEVMARESGHDRRRRNTAAITKAVARRKQPCRKANRTV